MTIVAANARYPILMDKERIKVSLNLFSNVCTTATITTVVVVCSSSRVTKRHEVEPTFRFFCKIEVSGKRKKVLRLFNIFFYFLLFLLQTQPVQIFLLRKDLFWTRTNVGLS